MPVKSTLMPGVPHNSIYPKLMENVAGTEIVLFTRPSVGMVVYAGTSCYGVGHYSETWLMDRFNDMKPGRKITLEVT